AVDRVTGSRKGTSLWAIQARNAPLSRWYTLCRVAQRERPASGLQEIPMLTRKLPAFCVVLAGCVLLAAAAAAQAPASRTDVTKGTGTVSTEQVSGEVVQIEGNNLLVKLSSGELKTFNGPEE